MQEDILTEIESHLRSKYTHKALPYVCAFLKIYIDKGAKKMDQHTLIISCVEYYSHLKNIPGNKVFAAFERANFISMILDSRKMFPEMNLDFYIGMIDGLTFLESDASDQDYSHHEDRSALIAEIVSMLKKKHKMDDLEACQMYYHSKTAEAVSEEKTGYYQKSPKEIFDLIEAE